MFVAILDQPATVSLQQQAWQDLQKSMEKTKIPEWSKVYDSAVAAFEEHIPLQPGWSPSWSRAGLRFFQFKEGRDIQTNWAWPLGLHENAHWSAPAAPTTPPNAKPDPGEQNDGSQEVGFMTPPQHVPTTPSSSERRLLAGAKESPSPPAPAKPGGFRMCQVIQGLGCAGVSAKVCFQQAHPRRYAHGDTPGGYRAADAAAAADRSCAADTATGSFAGAVLADESRTGRSKACTPDATSCGACR
ncbi:kptA [Symbiodinium necroappetens]|uniref:KptA protein n=1 Tax=Symbiodinium necroappetens TaxID=1628268 RepID=A0A812S992_9DINO|nr:kptA [Symbiodinium necroappetens]